jgi:hypothetical protein
MNSRLLSLVREAPFINYDIDYLNNNSVFDSLKLGNNTFQNVLINPGNSEFKSINDITNKMRFTEFANVKLHYILLGNIS